MASWRDQIGEGSGSQFVILQIRPPFHGDPVPFAGHFRRLSLVSTPNCTNWELAYLHRVVASDEIQPLPALDFSGRKE